MDNQQKQPADDKGLKDEVALITFVDQMIEERKDPNLKPEDRPKVRALLLKEVNEAINTHLISLLVDKDQIELDALLDKNPQDEEVDQFFMRKIPNLQAEIATALMNFRIAYMYPVLKNNLEQPVKKEELPVGPPPAPVFKKVN